MRRQITVFFVLAGFLMVAVPSLVAQGGIGLNDPQEAVRIEIERTEHVLERAEEIVSTSNHETLRAMLDLARELQEKAKQHFQAKNLREAAQFTLKAREIALRVINEGQSIGSTERRLERAAEMLDRAREAIQQSDDQRLITLYEAAKEQMRRAWELFRLGPGHDVYRALKLSREVEKIAERILSEANQQLHQRENFRRRVEKVKDLLERVMAQMSECDSEAGHRLAEQARNSFELALNMARQNHPRAALKSLQTVRRLAMAARRECSGGSDELLPRYERLVAEAERVAENLPRDNEQGQRLMEQVRQHLQMASEFIESDQSEAAVASLKAAQLTLNQLKNLLRRSGR